MENVSFFTRLGPSGSLFSVLFFLFWSLTVDARLGIACNALPGQDLQASFADWAAAGYPDVWEQVKKRGCSMTIEGLRRYKIPRDMKA